MESANQHGIVASMDRLNHKNNEIIVKELVTRTFDKFGKVRNPYNKAEQIVWSCALRDAVLRRMWKVFKIRGFVNDSIHYPFHRKEDGCDVDEKMFFDLAIKAVRESPDKKQLKEQKRNYYAEAYKSVPLKILKTFQDYIDKDCELFGYDCSPGTIFEGRKEGDEAHNLFSDFSFTFT